MKILVTGSEGFIGRHLVRHLRSMGHEVAGLDRTDSATGEAPEFRCDLLDFDGLHVALREFAPTHLIHLAARTDLNERDILSRYAANIDGVANVTAAVRNTPSMQRALFTSSQLVCKIGMIPSSPTKFAPDTLYGHSKVHTEQIVRASDGGGVEWCITRPTTVWGPGMSGHYRRFFSLIEAGRYFHVGRSNRMKSFGYVGNVVHQCAELLAAPTIDIHGKVFYLADYFPISLRGWADEFQRALNAPPIRSIPVAFARIGARVGDVIARAGPVSFPFTSFRLHNVLTEYVVDASATEQVCGPLPYTMAEGVAETVEWLRSEID